MATKAAPKIVETVDETVEEEGAPPKKKGKKLLVIGLLLLILIGGGGGAAWYVLVQKTHGKQEKHELKPSVYFPMDTFTVNLLQDGSGNDHFLQIGITFQLTEDSVIEAIKIQLPLIRNKILLLLSGKTPVDLSTVEGKKKLATEILAETRNSLPPGTGNGLEKGVQSVLFSSMIIQ